MTADEQSKPEHADAAIWADLQAFAAKYVGRVELSSEFLADGVEQADLEPTNPAAAPVFIILLQGEAAVTAGRAARFEFTSAPKGRALLTAFLEAVAAGTLTELVEGQDADYEVSLPDGQTLSGRTGASFRLLPKLRRGSPTRLTYEPY